MQNPLSFTLLPITYLYEGHEETIYPVILQDNTEMMLVDCCGIGQLPLLEKAAKKARIDLTKLTKVFITHQDHDHMGSLRALQKKYPQVQVMANAKEAPHISGEKKLLRLIQAENNQPNLPESQQEWGLKFQRTLKTVESSVVQIRINDGDTLSIGGGVTFVETAGHMPGHTCVYLNQEKILIAGDAFTFVGKKLILPYPEFQIDLKEAKKSLAKLARLEIEKVICYHGGEFFGNIREQLLRISK